MPRIKHLTRSLILVLLLGLGSTPAWSLDLSTKASLQAAMQTYLDQQLVDGAFLYLDEKKGEALVLHPVTAHPMIFTMGPHYVLCFDFRDAQGKDINLDLYMARKGNGYVVFQTEVGNHQLLDKMIADGKVSTTD
ncbi:MAG TPA: hypothetical protein VGB82_13990 [Alphaproteobacteria bacterium]